MTVKIYYYQFNTVKEYISHKLLSYFEIVLYISIHGYIVIMDYALLIFIPLYNDELYITQ